jgi:hypothetical protein
MILKVFSQNNVFFSFQLVLFAKFRSTHWFFVKKANFLQKIVKNSRKLSKIAENCEHYIDPWFNFLKSTVWRWVGMLHVYIHMFFLHYSRSILTSFLRQCWIIVQEGFQHLEWGKILLGWNSTLLLIGIDLRTVCIFTRCNFTKNKICRFLNFALMLSKTVFLYLHY